MSDPILIKASVTISYAKGIGISQEVKGIREVEVLTVHFAKGTMRIRYSVDLWDEGVERVRTVDIDAQPFFDQYNIIPKSSGD